MKLEIKKTILMENLNYVIKGISNKNIIPILNCIKFELTSDGLYLMSTDNEIAIKTFIESKNIENIDKLGEVVISGRYIYDIIKKLPNTIISIEEVVDNKIFINTEQSSFRLNCNDSSEFPTIDLNENKNPIFINQKIFKNIIKQTSFATSNEESRPLFTGINFSIIENRLECTTTDSHRLSLKKLEINNSMKESLDITIPTHTLNELIKLMIDEDKDVELHIFNNKVIFKFSNILLMSRLINGTYPDVSGFIPKEFSLAVKVNLNDFFGAIDRASLLTNEEDKNTIKLESKNSNFIISSNIPEIGNVEEIINIYKNKDEDIKIAFSSKYMIDALKSFECEEIELLFNGEIKPIIIRNVESDDLTQLIVPIRTI
ncbi:MAG: DNA polymerase III subunit beta [Bacilli bacterium]